MTENAARSTENLIQQLEGESSEDLPMREYLSLDKKLRSIRCSLKMEVVKSSVGKNASRKKSVSSRKPETIQNMMMGLEKRLGAGSIRRMTTYQSGRKASISSKVD